jgi:hypothetical protein
VLAMQRKIHNLLSSHQASSAFVKTKPK